MTKHNSLVLIRLSLVSLEHTQRMEVDEGSVLDLDSQLHFIAVHAC